MEFCRYLTRWMAVAAMGLGMAAGPGRALAQRPLGIDVSSYQAGSINWTNVKSSGVTFAWAKAAEGLTLADTNFVTNEIHAKAAGVLIGAYYYAHPEYEVGTAGADSAAAYFWSIAKNYIVTNGYAYLMPMLDFEQDVDSASPAYTAASLSAWVNEWCQDLVNYGKSNGVAVMPVVYTYISYAAGDSGNGPGLNETVTQWPLWMANTQYTDPQTGAPSGISPWSTWLLWQYCTTNIVSGVTTGAVDTDVFAGAATQMTNSLVIGKANAGMTNYWDPGANHASPGSGGAGTWDNSTSNWWLTGTADAAWSLVGNYPIFASTAGTVTLGATVSAYGLTFNTPGYVLSGSDTLVLNGATPVISVPAGSPTYIECVLGGSGYELTGGGVAVFTNPGNYSGNSASPEYINGPNTTLVVLTDHDAGNDGVTMNLENGGIYQDNDTTSGDEFLLPGCAISLLAGGGIFDNPNASLTMSNLITGSGSLTIIGTTYTLTLTDTANNNTGGTIVQSGELKAGAAGTLGSTSGPLTVSGGVLDLGGASHAVGPVTISGGTIQDGTLTGTSYAGQSGTVSAVLAGSGAMTKTTTNTLTLSAKNTYSGNTTISAGTLALGSAGAISNSPKIILAAGATFDVSAISAFALSSSTTFSAAGNSTAAAIKGGVTVNLGSQPIMLAYDGSDPALTISHGVLSLNGNAFTVNGPVLAGGVFTLVQQTSGNIAGSGSYSVTGTAIASTGAAAAISISGGSVILTVTDTTTTALNALTPSIYGQPATLTATVTPTPAGGTVQFYDDGMALGGPATVSGGTATFTTDTLPVGTNLITAAYGGAVGYAASATAAASVQQVTLPPNSIPVTISGAAFLGNGALQLSFAGVPGYTYYVQAATCLDPPVAWITVSTNVADINGLFSFTDQQAASYADRYYRTTTQ